MINLVFFFISKKKRRYYRNFSDMTRLQSSVFTVNMTHRIYTFFLISQKRSLYLFKCTEKSLTQPPHITNPESKQKSQTKPIFHCLNKKKTVGYKIQ